MRLDLSNSALQVLRGEGARMAAVVELQKVYVFEFRKSDAALFYDADDFLWWKIRWGYEGIVIVEFGLGR